VFTGIQSLQALGHASQRVVAGVLIKRAGFNALLVALQRKIEALWRLTFTGL
jgi:hypothetical protein